MALILFPVVFAALLCGYPVAFVLAGTSLLFALAGVITGHFDIALLTAIPSRIFAVMTNQTLLSVPLFILMGSLLEKSRIAEDLLKAVGFLLGAGTGSLAFATIIVGMLLAATTGIVGAGVVTLGLLALPVMLKNGYKPSLAAGTVTAAGTLGQIIPPSIVLIVLGDALITANQQVQMGNAGLLANTVSVGELFLGALLPGIGLALLYICYLLVISQTRPHQMRGASISLGTDWAAARASVGPYPAAQTADAGSDRDHLAPHKSPYATDIGLLMWHLLPPGLLMMLVLGTVVAGLATPTEAAALGSLGAFVLLLIKKGTLKKWSTKWSAMRAAVRHAALINTQIFSVLIGATLFALVFRGYGGDKILEAFLSHLPGGPVGAIWATVLLIFVLGFFLEFIEITVILVPILAPILIGMGADPLWLGVMIAVCLQTSFLTPPFGFALFYLRAVAPSEVTFRDICRGAVPFVCLQLLIVFLVWLFPQLATYLPRLIYQ